MAQWIDVTEMMPSEEGKEFRCWVGPNAGYLDTNGGLIVASTGFYERPVNTYRAKSGDLRFNCGSLEQVTHWQLPDPPKERE